MRVDLILNVLVKKKKKKEKNSAAKEGRKILLSCVR